jgi:hypothetical protein
MSNDTESLMPITIRLTAEEMRSATLAGVIFSDTDVIVRLTHTTMLAPAAAPDKNQNSLRIMTLSA